MKSKLSETSQKQSASGLESHVGYWLRFVSNHVSHAFMQKLQQQDVTVAEWALMRQMLEAGAANPSQLAAGMDMTRGAVSKRVDRLCHKGLVQRTASGVDRRYQSVALTRRGQHLVPRLAQLADQNDHELFGHWSSETKHRLVHELKQLVQRHGWKDIPVN